jgi:hypothetical protein
MYSELRQISRLGLLRFLRFEFLVFSWESEAILCVLAIRPHPVRFKVWRRQPPRSLRLFSATSAV